MEIKKYTFASHGDDAVLMVFASELYDESDYIRNYEDFLKYNNITKD